VKELEKRRLRQQVGSIFSPSAPVTTEDLFAGRTRQLRILLDAVPTRGQHAIVYGERGVGKTSIGRVLTVILEIDGSGSVLAPYVNCDSTDTFDSIWRKAFIRVPVLTESTWPDMPAVAESSAAWGLPVDGQQRHFLRSPCHLVIFLTVTSRTPPIAYIPMPSFAELRVR
jgi:hypothetical protein